MSWEIREGDALAELRKMPDASVHLTEAQAAYLAGLIDGEGSLECQKQMHGAAINPRYVVRLSFVFATAEPITTVAAWLGREPTWYPATDPTRQARWRLHIPKNALVPLLRACLPYLILKREQAEIILAIEAVRVARSPAWCGDGMPADAIQDMELLLRKLRALKSNKRPVGARG